MTGTFGPQIPSQHLLTLTRILKGGDLSPCFFVAKSIDFINPSLTEHSAPDEEAQSTLRRFYRMN